MASSSSPPPPDHSAGEGIGGLAELLKSALLPDLCKKRLALWVLIRTIYSDHTDILQILEDPHKDPLLAREEIVEIIRESNARLDLMVLLDCGVSPSQVPEDRQLPSRSANDTASSSYPQGSGGKGKEKEAELGPFVVSCSSVHGGSASDREFCAAALLPDVAATVTKGIRTARGVFLNTWELLALITPEGDDDVPDVHMIIIQREGDMLEPTGKDGLPLIYTAHNKAGGGVRQPA